MIKNILCLSTALFVLLSFKAVVKKLEEPKYIKVNTNGSLKYLPDAKGNTIPDFSHVGYHQGDKAIPAIAVAKTISANESGDSQQLLQNAIDEVAQMPLNKDGFRGAILLKKGTY